VALMMLHEILLELDDCEGGPTEYPAWIAPRGMDYSLLNGISPDASSGHIAGRLLEVDPAHVYRTVADFCEPFAHAVIAQRAAGPCC
jgi:hypothetical protein